jgi:hypothetical protein
VTESLQPGGWGSAISALKQRLDKVERKLRASGSFGQPEVTFVLGGPLYAIRFPNKRVPEDRVYYQLAIDLLTAGSTSTTVRVLKNGATHSTIVIAAGVTQGLYDLPNHLQLIGRSDTVSFQIVTAGTGADSITADLWR